MRVWSNETNAWVEVSDVFDADISMAGFAVKDLADPDDPQDAATKAYVDAAAVTPAAHLNSETATAGDIVTALIAAGLMAAS